VVFFNNDYYFVSLVTGNLYEFGTQFTTIELADGIVREIPRLRITPPVRLPSQRNFIVQELGFTIENGEKNIKTTETDTITISSDFITTEAGNILVTEGNDRLITENRQTQDFTYTNFSEAIDLSISRDGGESFGSEWRYDMQPTGYRKSRCIYQRLGMANDTTYKLRFSGFSRFVVGDGVVKVYQ